MPATLNLTGRYILTETVRMEIEGEIIDGGREEGEIVASNGLHYRWF